MSAQIAYLGPEGTFTEQAARQFARAGAQLVPVATVPTALTSLLEGEVEAAVVPFENSVEGSVPATLQALEDVQRVRIVAEELVRIQFSLRRPAVGGPPICPRPPWCPRPRRPARPRPWRRGATTWIADPEGAQTRFVVLRADAAVPPPTGVDRTTMLALIRTNRPGALLELLEQFAVRGIDLTRRESRPTGEGLGEYQFWIDADAHLSEPRLAEALNGLRRTCRDLRFYGSYPRADGRVTPVPRYADQEAYANADRWVRGLSGPAAASGPSPR